MSAQGRHNGESPCAQREGMATISIAARAQLAVGSVRHQRLRPKTHRFDYPTYFLLLPMRALRQLADPALARNRFGLLAFHDRDHGDGRDDCLAWLDEQLAREGVTDADGEVWLQTYPRVLGYAFKPVSFWYCHRSDGSLAAILAEVNNTFGERHCYLLAGPGLFWGHDQQAKKAFHVSPFCHVVGTYHFRFARSNGRIVARVEHHDEDGPVLVTSVSGLYANATPARQRAAFFGQPMMTLGVLARIHWQALILWAKRVPLVRKPVLPDHFVTR